MSKHNNQILLFVFSGILMFLGTCIYMFSNLGIFLYAYFFVFYAVLFGNMIIANKNPISSIFSIGVLLYFYQVPFIQFWAFSKVTVYSLNISDFALCEYYFLYAYVLFFNVLITQYLSSLNITIDNVRNSFSQGLISVALPLSILFTLIMFVYAIRQAGGFTNYLLLDKFESMLVAKILYFTWKDFLIVTMMLFFLKLKNSYLYLLFIFTFIFIEILTAKRLTLLFFAIFYYFSYVKKISLKSFGAMIIGLAGVNFIKFTYYNLKDLVTGSGSFKSIFWFEWSDFFKDSLLVGEFSGHLRLAYLYIYHDVKLPTESVFSQLIVGLPFGHTLVRGYQATGEYMRIYLGEEWSGLGASLYLKSYLNGSVFGLFFIYAIFILSISVFSSFAKNNKFALVTFYTMIPISFFYIQREEIAMMFKNTYVLGFVIFFVLIFSYPVYSLIKTKKYERKSL